MLIAEFAKATALSRDTIRFYVRKGLLTPEVGKSGTNRYQSFDAEQVERALLIREAQALGFTLREISGLSEEYARGMSLARQAQLMRERLAAVDEQAAKLARLRRYFAAKVAWLESGAVGEHPSFTATAGPPGAAACGPVLESNIDPLVRTQAPGRRASRAPGARRKRVQAS